MTKTLGTCERCGEYSEGRSKTMVYRVMETFPASPLVQQFFCDRCLRIMRWYAVAGFFIAGNNRWCAHHCCTMVTLWSYLMIAVYCFGSGSPGVTAATAWLAMHAIA